MGTNEGLNSPLNNSSLVVGGSNVKFEVAVIEKFSSYNAQKN